MRFFNLIQQNNRIRPAAHPLRQLTGVIIADIARRRSNQLRRRMLFHKLRHIKANQRVLAAKKLSGYRLGQFRFTDPGRADKNKGGRPQPWHKAGAAALNRRRNGGNRSVLSLDPAAEAVI